MLAAPPHRLAPGDFRDRFRARVELQGAILAAEELSHVGEWYPRCHGNDDWNVRQYARATGLGAREYRVVRGGSTQDVYRSSDLDHAAAVREALNELESQESRADTTAQNSSS